MAHKDERLQGITIDLKPYRKSHGGKRDGRSNETGKRAVVTKNGEDITVIHGSSFGDVQRKIRDRFKIPPSVRINSTGKTEI